MNKIVVTGADGQLGKCLQKAAPQFSDWQFDFLNKQDLDITNKRSVRECFQQNQYDCCINAAAYTNVEKAESEEETAFLVNAEAVKYLAKSCQETETLLLHVSTDYVFDGEKLGAYMETDPTNPINVYGASKLKGEAYIQEYCEKYFVVRSSWVYSEFGHNFMKSILRLAKERDHLTITTDQTGCPTNANDLANMLLHIIASDSKAYGVYHFCNIGKATWYDFAQSIVEFAGLSEKTNIGKTDDYPTFAKRPKNSVLDTTKLQQEFGVQIKDWKSTLKELINRL